MKRTMNPSVLLVKQIKFTFKGEKSWVDFKNLIMAQKFQKKQ